DCWVSSYWGNDYYHRVHIWPQRLDLGNLVSAQSSPVNLWNAFLEPRTLDGIAGLDKGIIVSGQPEPPLLFPALKELIWQVTVTPDGQPVLDTSIEWQFSNGDSAAVRVTANRIIAWSFAPDWTDGVTESLAWLTDVLTSETLVEQRRALRQAPRRSVQAAFY